jgi:acyl-coenzyme A thioesterase PaaI-like protein
MPISNTFDQIMEILQTRLGDHLDQYLFPPPVFTAMQAEFTAYDPEKQLLSVRFPVLEGWLNPYGIMQGGMVAAAIDNTIGPLSVLVAPPNVTRHMELKYSRAVTPEAEFITVNAWLFEQDGRWLTFKAEARNLDGQRLTRAKAVHWILDAKGLDD